MLKYDAHHYDDFLNLKISNSLWFSILYGVRHLFFVAVLKLIPDDVASMDWINIQANSFYVVTDVPAALVLLATGHRIPEALAIMRWIWANGKFILISSYISGICLFLYLNSSIIQGGDVNKFILAVCILVTDVIIMSFIFRSELIKDIFSEFPPARCE